MKSRKQSKLFGSHVAIVKSLEIGEGYALNIFSYINNEGKDKTWEGVSNPHLLTFEEMTELADFNI
jgi:hypothetical protein